MDKLTSENVVGAGGQGWREMIDEKNLLFSTLARNKREREERHVAC